jgi:hypothetical protein
MTHRCGRRDGRALDFPAVPGIPVIELALYLTPLLAIAALLLSGHYVGEERIVARRTSAAQPTRARCAQRWRPQPVRVLRSVLEPGAAGVRGPPVTA